MKRGRHERSKCKHKKTQTTDIAGVQRTVCRRCGFRTFEFEFDAPAEEHGHLEALPQDV